MVGNIDVDLSCGVATITGLYGYPTVEDSLKAFLGAYKELARRESALPLVLFSDAIAEDDGVGENLADELDKMGEVIRSGHRVNPNSGNRIEVYIWKPHGAVMKRINKEVNEEREAQFKKDQLLWQTMKPANIRSR